MKTILFLGDSNTWGFQGDTPQQRRLPFEQRFVGIVANAFPSFRVLSEGYPGRTVCFDDPTDYGCCGLKILPIILRSHDPIDLVVVMLGTNDAKCIFHTDSPTMAKAMERLVQVIQNPLYWSETGTLPQILLIAPPRLGDVEHSPTFHEIFDARSRELVDSLPQGYAAVAERYSCWFLDGSQVAAVQCSDQVHLTASEHAALGNLIVRKLHEMGFGQKLDG